MTALSAAAACPLPGQPSPPQSFLVRHLFNNRVTPQDSRHCVDAAYTGRRRSTGLFARIAINGRSTDSSPRTNITVNCRWNLYSPRCGASTHPSSALKHWSPYPFTGGGIGGAGLTKACVSPTPFRGIGTFLLYRRSRAASPPAASKGSAQPCDSGMWSTPSAAPRT